MTTFLQLSSIIINNYPHSTSKVILQIINSRTIGFDSTRSIALFEYVIFTISWSPTIHYIWTQKFSSTQTLQKKVHDFPNSKTAQNTPFIKRLINPLTQGRLLLQSKDDIYKVLNIKYRVCNVSVLNIGQYTSISTGIPFLGLKHIVRPIFFPFSFWADIKWYITHVTIYRMINKMKNIGEINMLLFFSFFSFLDLDPLIWTL